jgi:hypothetical protein
MDFEDTPEEAAYRAQVKAWLEANKDALPEGDAGSRAESVTAAKRWQARKFEAGYVGITWRDAADHLQPRRGQI